MFRPVLGITRGSENTGAMVDGADTADDTLENGMGYSLVTFCGRTGSKRARKYAHHPLRDTELIGLSSCQPNHRQCKNTKMQSYGV